MRRAVLLAVLVALAPLTGAAMTDSTGGVQEQPTGTDGGSEGNVPSGARLAGVVGSQGAAIDGEVTERSLAQHLARANDSGAKAAAIAAALGDANATLDSVESRLAELRAEREAGDISGGAYRAKVAIVAQRGAAARAVANRSAAASESIPAAALAERGIGPGAARNVSERAGRVVGQDVAEIARGITGGPPGGTGIPGIPGGLPGSPPDGEGAGVGNGPPGSGAGGPSDGENGTDASAEPGANGGDPGPGHSGTDAERGGPPTDGADPGTATADAPAGDGSAPGTAVSMTTAGGAGNWPAA